MRDAIAAETISGASATQAKAGAPNFGKLTAHNTPDSTARTIVTGARSRADGQKHQRLRIAVNPSFLRRLMIRFASSAVAYGPTLTE